MGRLRTRSRRRSKGDEHQGMPALPTAARRPRSDSQSSPATSIQLATRLPQERNSQALRQAAFLDIQKQQGNQRLQRLMAEEAWSLEKAARPAAAQQKESQPAAVQISPTRQPAHIQRGLWGKIKKAAKKVGSAVKKGAQAVAKGAKKAAGAVKKVAQKVGAGVKKGAKAVGKGVKALFKKVGAIAKKVGQKVKGGAKVVWGAVKGAAKKVGGFAKRVWGGVKKAGKAVAKGAKKVWTGAKWVAKQTWSKIKGAGLRVVNWARQLPARLKRLFTHLWNGVKSLKPWSLDWWRSLGKGSTWLNFLSWLGELAVYGLETAGIGEAYETIMDFIKFNTRPLTGDEKSKAQSVFGSTIQYDLVRVDERALLGPSWTKREYVSFHTINGWGTMDDHTFIHEMTHVWQYSKTGAMYMPKAIHAQAFGEGYDYGGVKGLEDRLKSGGGLTSFNPEQQGQIVADYYMRKTGQRTATPEQLAVYEHFGRQAKR